MGKLYNRWTSLFSGLIALGSPRRAASWRQHRELYRTYTAGEASGNNQLYRPRSRTAEADIKRAAKILTARVRDQAQNNSFISGGIERICNNTVRRGIRPQFNFRTRDGHLDKDTNTFWDRQFSTWARHADLSGHDSYWSLQKLGLRHLWIDGHYLVHRVYDTSLAGVVPLRLEYFEMDQLDTSVDGELENGNIARRGIELDKTSARPVAYHILDQHPGDYLALGGLHGSSHRYDAKDIIHVFDRRRISQFSGVSWLAAVVMEAYDMSEYRNNERQGAKTAAAFAAFVETAYPEFRIGGQLPAGGQAGPVSGAAENGAAERPTEVLGGRIQYLPDGTKITLASHARPGSSYEPFVNDSLRGQSAGLGMSFEAFANNYTAASWSSARSGALEEQLSYQSQQFLLNEKQNSKVVLWFLEAAYLAGMQRGLSGFTRAPHSFVELVSWQEPGWDWVDKRNQAAASQIMIEEVLDTRRNIAARRGEDWDEILTGQIEEEQQLAELYKLRLQNQQVQKELTDAQEI